MRLVACLIALIPAVPLVSGAADRTLDEELLGMGFVRGAQDDSCSAAPYFAEIVNGNLRVRTATRTERAGFKETLSFAGKSVRYEAENGGEFGGKLDAVLETGERRLMLHGNTQSLVPTGKDLYVFEGLSHLSMSTGAIFLVRNYDRDPKPQREPMTLLPDTPVYAALATLRGAPPKFWVVGTHSLVSVIPDWGVLHVDSWNEFWVREVSSLAQDDRGVVIGTCGGVIAIETPCRRVPRSRGDSACPARFYLKKKS